MKSITIATFISNMETFNFDFLYLIDFLKEKSLNVETIVFCDNFIPNLDLSFKQIVTSGMTKYLRIKKLIEVSTNNFIFCIDNDMIIQKENFYKFIMDCKNNNALSWGRIKTIHKNNFISYLIDIDKIISHNFIRPFLWKNNIGISLPGQIFMINKKYYINKLYDTDTVYDDLFLGVITKKNSFPIFFTKEILGYENPKDNLVSLIKQRKRWAKGYAETIKYNKNTSELKYIIIHGLMYHILPIVWIIVLWLLFFKNPIIATVLLLSISFILIDKEISKLVWSICYLLIFPYIHIIWLFFFIKNLIDID